MAIKPFDPFCNTSHWTRLCSHQHNGGERIQFNSILLIDDDDSIRATFQVALELEGFNVTTATNGKDGLEKIPKMDALPCLILLDLMMPVMDGWTFVDELEKNTKWAGIPVVVISAFNDRSRTIKAQRIVQKPIELDALYEIAHKYCD